MKCLWDITPAQESLITSIVFCGTMIGAYSWGVLSDAKGRRAGFFATAIFTFVFGVLSAASPNYVVRGPSSAVQHTRSPLQEYLDMCCACKEPFWSCCCWM